jgi:threonine dehydratase
MSYPPFLPAAIGIDVLDSAQRVIDAELPATPLVRISEDRAASPVYLKLETLQPTGSFKVRGALTACRHYASAGRRIVTASAGNHGLGVAFAAQRMGVAATVVVPRNTAKATIAALRQFGAETVVDGADYDEAEKIALRAVDDATTFVSAYSDPWVIAGQATVVAEIANELDGPVDVVVPVGGGGLAAGCALAARRSGRVTVIGVEAASSRAVSTAMFSGRIETLQVTPTLADSLAGNLNQNSITPAILRNHNVEIVAVSETEIARAITDLIIDHGVVAEPAGAVGYAALIGGLLRRERPVVVVITGRNLAAQKLIEVLNR